MSVCQGVKLGFKVTGHAHHDLSLIDGDNLGREYGPHIVSFFPPIQSLDFCQV